MSYPLRWFDDRGESRPERPDEHAALVELEREQDALRAPIPACEGCYDSVSGEFGPGYPCDYCRASDLAAIDLDGYDDHTEQPKEIA